MIEKTKQAVQALYPEIMETVRTISGIDRGSRCLPGLRKTADYLKGKLEEAGCAITVHDDAEYGPVLVGRKKGRGKLRVFLYAHMDTVWPEGTCAARPYREEGRFAYAPGVSDCTHGIIGQLYALKALNSLGVDDYGELILLFNPDEELYSPSSGKWITHYAKLADVAFCMEGADEPDQYISHRGGVIFFEIEVKGVKSHAGVMPERGRNAIEELCHKVVLVHNLRIPDAIPHVTLIGGGISEGMVPDTAWAHVDIRVDSFEAIDACKAAMAEIEKNTMIEGTQTICHFREGGCLPLVRTPEVDKFCKLVDAHSAEAGLPLHEAFCGGGADAVLSALAGTPTLDGLSPMTYDCHTDHEHLDLESIVPRITTLAEVIQTISRDDGYLRAGREDE